MMSGRAFRWLMTVAALLPAGPVSGQRSDTGGKRAIEQPTAQAVLFRHYF